MSWQANVDGLVGTNKVSQGAIVNIGKKDLEAASEGFTLKTHTVKLTNELDEKVDAEVNEMDVVLQIPEKKGMLPSPPGIWMNGKVYHLIDYRDDVDTAYLKTDKGGACVVKTNKLIIIGIWSEDAKQNGGDCNDAVERLAENFKNSGY